MKAAYKDSFWAGFIVALVAIILLVMPALVASSNLPNAVQTAMWIMASLAGSCALLGFQAKVPYHAAKQLGWFCIGVTSVFGGASALLYLFLLKLT